MFGLMTVKRHNEEMKSLEKRLKFRYAVREMCFKRANWNAMYIAMHAEEERDEYKKMYEECSKSK